MKRVVRRAILILTRPIKRWMYDVQFDIADYRGITLRTHYLAPDGLRKNIEKALDLIAETDPVSFENAKRLFTGGIVTWADDRALATYVHTTKTCFLSHSGSASLGRSGLAALLVHELCHARLFAMGVAHAEHQRVRIEHICMKREIAFLRRLQDAVKQSPAFVSKIQTLIDITEDEIADLDDANYTDEAVSRRQRQRLIDRLKILKQISIPRWLRKTVILRTRRHVRRLRAAALTGHGKETTSHVAPPSSGHSVGS